MLLFSFSACRHSVTVSITVSNEKCESRLVSGTVNLVEVGCGGSWDLAGGKEFAFCSQESQCSQSDINLTWKGGTASRGSIISTFEIEI